MSPLQTKCRPSSLSRLDPDAYVAMFSIEDDGLPEGNTRRVRLTIDSDHTSNIAPLLTMELSKRSATDLRNWLNTWLSSVAETPILGPQDRVETPHGGVSPLPEGVSSPGAPSGVTAGRP